MRKIAVANMKGGVGKTTTSIVLADALSAIAGNRVLALDLDAQCNLSWALLSPAGLQRQSKASTMTRWLSDAAAAKPGAGSLTPYLEDVGLEPDESRIAARGGDVSRAGLHLAVADTRMRFVEFSFEGPLDSDPALQLSVFLQEALDELSENYDYVVMDCSPALSALTRAGLRCADAVIVPTPLNRLCLTSATTFQDVALKQGMSLDCPLYVVPTRVSPASGRAERADVSRRINLGVKAGRWKRLDPEFPERVEYTRALDPPESGPDKTLKSRYGSRVADLELFLNSLKTKGVI